MPSGSESTRIKKLQKKKKKTPNKKNPKRWPNKKKPTPPPKISRALRATRPHEKNSGPKKKNLRARR